MSRQPKRPMPETYDSKETSKLYRVEGVSAIMEKEGIKLTIVENIVTGASQLKVQSLNKNAKPLYYDISDIYRDPRNLYTICDNGFYLTPVSVKGVVQAIKDFISEEVKKYKLAELEHNEIGHTADGAFAYIDGVYLPDGDMKVSKYTGKLRKTIERQGTLEDCICGVKKMIAPNLGLSVALLAGLSGVIVHNLNHLDVGKIIISLWGASSCGKTIGGKVAVFSFGNKTLIPSLETTIAGYSKLSQSYGVVPVVMDDFSINRKIKPENYATLINGIFNESSGVNGNSQDIIISHSPTVFTSEQPLIPIMENYTRSEVKGYIGRFLEIDISKHPLVNALKDAEALELFMNENSGQLAPELINFVFTNDTRTTLVLKYRKWLDMFRSRLSKSNLMNRLSKSLAVIMVTGEVFNERFGNVLPLEPIFDFISDCAAAQLPSTYAELTPYKRLEQYVSSNAEKIASCRKSYSPGHHTGYRDNGCVFINESVFDENFKDAYTLLVNEGIILKKDGESRYKHFITKNKERYWFYAVKLNERGEK